MFQPCEGGYDGDTLTAQVKRSPDTWELPEGTPKISVIFSQPRLGFTDNFLCTMQMLQKIPNARIVFGGGFPWEAALSASVSMALADNDPDYLLFTDFDSLFTQADLFTLLNVMQTHPELAAVYPLQAHRHHDGPLVEPKSLDYSTELTETPHAHFGLTLVRAKVFEYLPTPWFWALPNPVTHNWGAGSLDPDIFFWERLRQVGARVARHNGVMLGHMELCSMWLDKDGKRIFQTVGEYRKVGRPKEAVWHGGPQQPSADDVMPPVFTPAK